MIDNQCAQKYDARALYRLSGSVNMREIYEINSDSLIQQDTVCDYCEISIQKVTLLNAGFFMCIYWNLITFGKARIYTIIDNANNIIHYSYVIPKCYKFPFLRGHKFHDIEIGPCFTDASFRGQGIYPYVISQIVLHELGENDKAFVIVDSRNTASLRGIFKVGFKKIGIIKKDWLKRHVILR